MNLVSPALGANLSGAGSEPGTQDSASRRGLSPGISLTLLSYPAPLPRELDGWIFLELDVGSEGNSDGAQIQEVLQTLVSRGSIASYTTSLQGFQFRRLGSGEPILGPQDTSHSFSDTCAFPWCSHQRVF